MMSINCDNELYGMVICDDIKPDKVEIVYEDAVPYLKYSGRSKAYKDKNVDETVSIIIEIPRISLRLESFEQIEKEEFLSLIPRRHAYISFEVLSDIDLKVDEEV